MNCSYELSFSFQGRDLHLLLLQRQRGADPIQILNLLRLLLPGKHVAHHCLVKTIFKSEKVLNSISLFNVEICLFVLAIEVMLLNFLFRFMYANLGVRPGELHWYYYPGIVGHYFSFFGGVFFMVGLYLLIFLVLTSF
jgi:hypothetical protein